MQIIKKSLVIILSLSMQSTGMICGAGYLAPPGLNETFQKEELPATDQSALKLYESLPLLQKYEVTDLKSTLHWLAENRAALGGNSLSYLVQALSVAGKLPKGTSHEEWQRSAGAYDFYLGSDLLQGYEVTDLEGTLHWLAAHRKKLGRNSLSYLVHALSIAGKLPEKESLKTWQFEAAAYDFYLDSDLLQEYEVTDLEGTLYWLAAHRKKLGGNSLAYLVQALSIAGKLPKGTSNEEWQRSAGAYDFYLDSDLLQRYEVADLESTLRWLAVQREALGGNSLGYLVQALSIAGKLPEKESLKTWQFEAAAYDFYLDSDLLQEYEVTDLERTLHWLAAHREALGGNSLSYLVQALSVAGKLPKGTNNEEWQRSAAAYDFYLGSEHLQGHEVTDLESTLHWLAENREALGGNSLVYLVRALSIAGKLPEGASRQTWTFEAGAMDRALKEKEIISNEIKRIWSQEPTKKYELSRLSRLKQEFDPLKLLNLRTKNPLSSQYRDKILKHAYDLYGKELIDRINKQSIEGHSRQIETAL